MLLHVKYGYHARAIPRRARQDRDMTFFDDTAVEIDEISASETEPKMEIRERGEAYRILGHDGRLFVPVRGVRGNRFDFATWCAEREAGEVPHDECDPLGLGPLISTAPPGEKAIFGNTWFTHEWPDCRIEEALLRRVLEDRREATRVQVQRNARKLLLIDGALHVETSEPVWVADYFGNRLIVRGGEERMRDRTCLIHRGERPFADFEIFRLDRKRDAVASFTDNRWYDDRRSVVVNMPSCETSAYVPAAPDTAPMLALVMDFARELVVYERRSRDAKYPPKYPSNYLDLMADFPFPSRQASPYHHVMAMQAIKERLHDRLVVGDDDGEVFAFMECLRPAIRRGLKEIEQGLIAVADLAAEDDAALSGLAP